MVFGRSCPMITGIHCLHPSSVKYTVPFKCHRHLVYVMLMTPFASFCTIRQTSLTGILSVYFYYLRSPLSIHNANA